MSKEGDKQMNFNRKKTVKTVLTLAYWMHTLCLVSYKHYTCKKHIQFPPETTKISTTVTIFL